MRKNIGLKDPLESKYGIAYLEEQQERFKCKTATAAIEKIFEEHAMLRAKVESRDELVDAIFDRFKTELDVLRIRSGYVDKNVRVLLELWNGHLIANKQENYVSTKTFKASALKDAETTVSNILTEHQIKMKERAEKKKQREAMKHE